MAEVGPGVPRGVWPAGTTGFPPGLVRPPIIVDVLLPEQRLKRSEGVQQALLIHRVDPEYPAIARQAHLQGTVQLRAIIARDGTVRSI